MMTSCTQNYSFPNHFDFRIESAISYLCVARHYYFGETSIHEAARSNIFNPIGQCNISEAATELKCANTDLLQVGLCRTDNVYSYWHLKNALDSIIFTLGGT